MILLGELSQVRTLVAGLKMHYKSDSILIILAGIECQLFPHRKAALKAAFDWKSVEA
jgi:hypothetical protein